MSTVLSIVSQEKVCRLCKTSKPLSEFYKRQSYHLGVISDCKECCKARQRNARKPAYDPELSHLRYKKWRSKMVENPERYKHHSDKKNAWNKSDKYLDGYYKKRFGISLEDFNNMMAIQNGRCGNIGCSRPIALRPKEEQAKAVVDHDHATGKVRALMCVRCNCMLGHIELNMNLLPGLLDYLNKHTIRN